MREIKFRAWNGHQMLTWDWLSAMGYVGMMLTDRKRFESIMQYTGLKDKNSKEIYEGDILYFDVIDEHPSVVRFVQGMFCIEEDGSWFPISQFYSTCEVIGNIYEHPELLDSRKVEGE